MVDPRTAPYAALLLRLALGTALLAHSVWLKVFVFTMPGTAAFFESLGVPGPLAWAVLAVEVAAGVLLLLGIRTRIAALAVLPVLLGAAWAQSGAGWMFANAGGGWEYPAFWTVALVVQALLGDGALAVGALRRQLPTGAAAQA